MKNLIIMKAYLIVDATLNSNIVLTLCAAQNLKHSGNDKGDQSGTKFSSQSSA